MTFRDLLSQKKEIGELIKNELTFPKKHKSNGVIYLRDISLVEELEAGLSELPANFVIVHEEHRQTEHKNIVYVSALKEEYEIGMDFIVCDNERSSLDAYFKKGIVPIVPEKNYMGSLLQEFNPVKNEGNSFFYTNETSWNVFYAIVRYLENHKFPYDNKNLVKNIFEM